MSRSAVAHNSERLSCSNEWVLRFPEYRYAGQPAEPHCVDDSGYNCGQNGDRQEDSGYECTVVAAALVEIADVLVTDLDTVD